MRNELRPVGLTVLLKPVRVHQPRGVFIGVRLPPRQCLLVVLRSGLLGFAFLPRFFLWLSSQEQLAAGREDFAARKSTPETSFIFEADRIEAQKNSLVVAEARR